jgi:hypothetical protein
VEDQFDAPVVVAGSSMPTNAGTLHLQEEGGCPSSSLPSHGQRQPQHQQHGVGLSRVVITSIDFEDGLGASS